MNYLPYILFACVILYLFFGAYVYRLNPKAQANRLFLLICACYCVWAFSYTNIHSVELKEDVWFWHRTALPATIFFSMLIVHFFLSFTGGKRRLRYPALIIYAPGFLFLTYSIIHGRLGAEDFVRRNGIWIEQYGFGNPVDALYYAWHALLMGLSIALIFEWRRKARSKQEKKQAGVMLVSGFPAVILTLLAPGIHLAGQTDFPNLAPAAGAIWITGIWYAVSKYGFLSITPDIAFDAILKSMAEGLLLTDAGGKIKWANSSALAITGFNRGELINSGVKKLFRDKNEPGAFFSSGNPITQDDSVLVSKDGREIPVFLSIAEVVKEDRLAGYVFSFQDITERKLAEEKIRRISFHDNLTGLYNRAFVEEEFKRLDTPRQLPLSVIICDINGLKPVNDFYGHIAGDRLILNAAGCIKSSCRQEDIIARWGGDEFIIFLPQTPPADAEMITERIRANCKHSPGEPAPLSMSAGTASKENEEEEINAVIKRADDLMYADKLNCVGPPGIRDSRGKSAKTILIVEDEEEFSEALTLRLLSCGYEVHTAANPEKGLAAAKEIKPDVVIMDVIFPGEMDGCRATELIKKERGLEKIPVIMVSAKTMDEDIKRGMKSGADFYLAKPLDSRNLLERIDSLEKDLS